MATQEKLVSSSKTDIILILCMGIGLLTLGIGLVTDASRFWRAYLLHNLLFLGFGIGAMFFLVFHYLAGSGWFVLIRRVPEAMVNYCIVAAFATALLFIGIHDLYPWTNHEFMEADHLLHNKIGYFNSGFWFLRLVLFLGVLVFFSQKVIRNSLLQDEEGGVELRQKQKPLSAGFLVLFCPLLTLFAIDVLKSLEPKWFSTIFGVYLFSGFMQSSAAIIIICLYFLKKYNYLKEVRADHIHDLGKYMFGWTIFWAYICFSQYMLIWYANLPEETFYFINREKGSWLYVGLFLLLIKFILPFLLLLPRAAKRNIGYLSCVGGLVLFSQWLDLNWMIMPSYAPNGFVLGWQDFGCLVGFLGLFVFTLRSFWKKHSMTPLKDPYRHESEKHHVMFA